MNSMIFTKTPLKKKKPVIYGTNNKGQYYSDVKVPIKNFITTPIANRIDKNMTNLQVPTNLTDKNLNKFINPVLNNENLENNITNDSQNIIKMNLETNKKYFNSFATELNTYEINNITNDNPTQDYEIFFKMFFNNKSLTLIEEMLNDLHSYDFTIENVYQEKYGDINASGFGDFLRGSYFLMQFCDQHDFSFNINMLNHPISQFLEIYTNKQSSTYSNVYLFGITNFKAVFLDDNILSNEYNPKINTTFIHFLNLCALKKNSYKKIHSYIISYPNTPILEKHKLHMQQLLKPTTQFLSIIHNTLDELGLVEKKFIIIHIRYGDRFLLKNIQNIDSEHLKIIYNLIDSLFLDSNFDLDSSQQVLLISDNINIKDIIVKKYPFIKTHLKQITHTGEGSKIDNEKLKNTMLDFYLFSFASKIFAFSVYDHGTGFSKWAAETYSIPYVCRFLP
jgi:hypothetical protein